MSANHKRRPAPPGWGKGMTHHQLRLTPGEPSISKAPSPVIEFVPWGTETYIWVGNDDDTSKVCIGYADGPALRSFVAELHRALTARAPESAAKEPTK